MSDSEESAACPNCGALRSGNFCAACGQSSKTYMRATWEIAREAMDEVLGFDSRLARTAKALFSPGKLTLEYRSGRRASYLSPVRLYLLVSVVFFSIVSIENRLSEVDPFAGSALDEHAILADTKKLSGESDMDEMYTALSRAQREHLRAVMASKGLATDAVRNHLDALDAAHPPAERVESTFDAKLMDRALDIAADPRGTWQKVVNDLPIAMFLTLPIYAGCLKALYRRRFYAEHLVFALHLHAFLFAIGTLIVALPDAPSAAATGLARSWSLLGSKLADALKLVGIVYYALALHAVYAERWLRAIVKFTVINAAHAAVIGLSILATGAAAVFVF